MILHPDTPYYPIPSGSSPQSTFGAIVEILLKARMKLRLETCQERYEEDVNAYLAGLLVSYIDPTYLTAVSEAVSKYDLDVYQSVAQADDKVHVYWIYKVNADDLLVSLGIFHRLWKEARADVGKLKRYYAYASEYQRRIYGKFTTVGKIQSKLAEDSERYLTILSEVRRDYLHFVDAVRSEDLTDFRHKLDNFAAELPIKEKQDELLDAFSEWSNCPDDKKLRSRLLQLVEELRGVDPDFKPDRILSRITPP